MKLLGNPSAQQRTKSPYVNTQTITKTVVEKPKDIRGTPEKPEKIQDRMQAIKNMIINPDKKGSSTKQPNTIINTQLGIQNNVTSLMDKMKMVEKKVIISSKIEEYKKSVKSKGYSKSIDTNIPQNTLSNGTKVPEKKIITNNNKSPFGKFANFK